MWGNKSITYELIMLQPGQRWTETRSEASFYFYFYFYFD